MIEITIFIAIFSAAIYALTGFLKSTGEEIDIVKALATMLIGAAIGASLYIAGIPISEQAIVAQMAAYAGLTAIIENALKYIWRSVLGHSK